MGNDQKDTGIMPYSKEKMKEYQKANRDKFNSYQKKYKQSISGFKSDNPKVITAKKAGDNPEPTDNPLIANTPQERNAVFKSLLSTFKADPKHVPLAQPIAKPLIDDVIDDVTVDYEEFV